MQMLKNFGEWCKNFIPNFMGLVEEVTADSIMFIVANILTLCGSIGEFLGMLMIVVGLFLMKFRITKIFRLGFVVYFISLLCELVGLVLR